MRLAPGRTWRAVSRHPVRRALDALYLGAGVLAALFLIAILAIIVVQMVARWSGRDASRRDQLRRLLHGGGSFFAFAHALNRGAHIRVGILFNALGPGGRRALEIWCFGIATLLAWFLARYAVKLVSWSWKLGDVSQGQDATPLWIPQMRHGDRRGDLRHRADRPAGDAAAGRRGGHRRGRGLRWRAPPEARPGARRMNEFGAIGVFLFVLFLLLGTGVWVGLALLGVAWVGMELFTSRPAGDAMITTIWTASSSWTLTALPLFIWMGEILYRTRLSEDMFRGLSPWMAGCRAGSCTPTSSAARCSRRCRARRPRRSRPSARCRSPSSGRGTIPSA